MPWTSAFLFLHRYKISVLGQKLIKINYKSENFTLLEFLGKSRKKILITDLDCLPDNKPLINYHTDNWHTFEFVDKTIK